MSEELQSAKINYFKSDTQLNASTQLREQVIEEVKEELEVEQSLESVTSPTRLVGRPTPSSSVNICKMVIWGK